MVYQIRKRSGELVEFNRDKIFDAIWKSVLSVGGHDDTIAAGLTDLIVAKLDVDFPDDDVPSVEVIQDVVEKVLVKQGHSKVAKSYILYRARRTEVRNAVLEGIAEKGMSGKLNVLKRNGDIEHFDLHKVKNKLIRLSDGLGGYISFDLIVKELMRNIFEGMKSDDVDKSLIMATSSFIERDLSYSYLAARLLLEKIYREVFDCKISSNNFSAVYHDSFVTSIKTAVEDGPLDPALLDFDLDLLSKNIIPFRDLSLQYMGVHTLYERYFVNIDKKVLETPQYFFMRVAMGLALNEEDKNTRAIEFYNLLSSLRFMPSTPTLFNSGNKRPQLSSCYLSTVGDDLGSIFKTYSDNAHLSKWSGGLGNDWTNLRSTGAYIKGTGVESQGVIPFLKIASDVTAAINRSGRRRGATCAYLETWHLDIEDFLDLRKNTGDDRRRTHDMNTSNWIPDLFMKRVLDDGNWTLFSPHEVPDLHETYGSDFEKRYIEYEGKAADGSLKQSKVVSAKNLWRKMISMLFETGHPWITFKDPCNIRSPQDHVGVIHSSNLCTEITLNTSSEEIAVCNLGSVNLSNHVTEFGEIDYALLHNTIDIAIRMLDNVIDLNFYPATEARHSNMKHRPVGLGVMGLQDLFFKMNIPFSSPQALDISDELMEHISYYAIGSSSDLAVARGSYSTFSGSKWDRGIFPLDTVDLLEKERGVPIDVSRESRLDWDSLKRKVSENGLRNSNLMAIAPTATISTISGCYPCTEPIYKNIYVKSNMSGEFTIINSYLSEDLKALGLWDDDMIDALKYYDGNVSLIKNIPADLAEKYKESFDIDPTISIMHNALRSKWIDMSQSHNMFIKGTSGKLISDSYLFAWKSGLKTTYYLRSLAASQIEKSTLDASKYGFTQKREYNIEYKEVSPAVEKNVVDEVVPASTVVDVTPVSSFPVKQCRIDDPDCEACQ